MQDLQEQALKLSNKLTVLFPDSKPRVSPDNSTVRINVQEIVEDDDRSQIKGMLFRTAGIKKTICIRRSGTGMVIIYNLKS